MSEHIYVHFLVVTVTREFLWCLAACVQGCVMSCPVNGQSSTMQNFLSLLNFQKRPNPLRKTAGDNRKPLKDFE